MSNARLLSLKLRRFKSYEAETEIPLAPLTVVLGRNNSGKSSIIQALLLLKQTLALPRPEVPLHLDGMVEALNLRELTFGFPPSASVVPGPEITLRWSSRIDMAKAYEEAGRPDFKALVKSIAPGQAPILWDLVEELPGLVVTEISLRYAEVNERVVLQRVVLAAYRDASLATQAAVFTLERQADGSHQCFYGDEEAPKIQVEFDHFLPYFLIDRRNIASRDRQRAWHTLFLILFAEPLDDLKALLTSMSYLGSMRSQPHSLYRPVTVPPEDIGVSGEYAAQMLHARRTERVHFLPPLRIEGDTVEVPDEVRSRTLEDAMNEVLKDLGVDAPLSIADVKDAGFRLLFGQANLQHVGRGLSYLLPVIQLGLVADPLRFKANGDAMPLADYAKACPRSTHCAFEEPEAHLHPKVQSRLAHWFVALAMAERQILVETHSDHMVRRLRGLAARAKPGSALEKWLLENVRVLHVDQQDGKSTVKQATLTAQGGLEDWPHDFMDAATDEERSIYDASLDKPEEPEPSAPAVAAVEHDPGEEPETGA